MLFICSLDRGNHLDACLSLGGGQMGRWEGLLVDKGESKNQLHQIILAIELTARLMAF